MLAEVPFAHRIHAYPPVFGVPAWGGCFDFLGLPVWSWPGAAAASPLRLRSRCRPSIRRRRPRRSQVEVPEDGRLDILLSASDADGEIVSWEIVERTGHGLLQGAAPNLTYTPDADFFGSDALRFTVTDDDGAVSEPAEVAITVTSVNDLPTADDLALSGPEDEPVSFRLSASDPDGEVDGWELVAGPGHGEVSGDWPDLTYVPEENFFGEDSFRYVVRDDAGGLSEPAEVMITLLSGPWSVERKRRLIRASRLAARATLGMRFAEVEAIADRGIELWIDDQLAMPKTSLLEAVDHLRDLYERGQLAHHPAATRIPVRYLTTAQWQVAMTAPDQLAQRMTLALSEILVVSAAGDAQLARFPDAIAVYSDVLLEHSLGSFRELLLDVTRNPAMGRFLSHMHNRKAVPSRNIYPDENYARELMQLFTIGLYELNRDGTLKLDADGRAIPTYDAEDVRNFARVFTGLGMTGFRYRADSVAEWRRPMRMHPQYHDDEEKALLNGAVLPAGKPADSDIEMAIDNLFEHPNTAPFISRQLIQRLVTSNPSPAYIDRVAAAFEAGPGGGRGNLGAVVKAILLDPEADAAPIRSSDFGKLRAPAMRQFQLARQFGARPDDTSFFWTGSGIAAGQFYFRAPSVFNFYLPTHIPSGEFADADLLGPEFQITDAINIIRLGRWYARSLAEGGNLLNSFGGPGAALDVRDYQDMAHDADALVGRLDILMTYGQLSRATESVVRDALDQFDGSPEERVRLAIFLIANSPDYAVAH